MKYTLRSIVIGCYGLKSSDVWNLQNALHAAADDYSTLEAREYIAWFNTEEYQDSVSWWAN